MPARLGLICVQLYGYVYSEYVFGDRVANCQIKRLSGFENHCFGTKTSCNATQKNQKKNFLLFFLLVLKVVERGPPKFGEVKLGCLFTRKSTRGGETRSFFTRQCTRDLKPALIFPRI
jgi:hypothetical protein